MRSFLGSITQEIPINSSVETPKIEHLLRGALVMHPQGTTLLGNEDTQIRMRIEKIKKGIACTIPTRLCSMPEWREYMRLLDHYNRKIRDLRITLFPDHMITQHNLTGYAIYNPRTQMRVKQFSLVDLFSVLQAVRQQQNVETIGEILALFEVTSSQLSLAALQLTEKNRVRLVRAE